MLDFSGVDMEVFITVVGLIDFMLLETALLPVISANRNGTCVCLG